jgi:WD40 repeat protein/uncharacterized membrane protein YqaE (UPF0057 family)
MGCGRVLLAILFPPLAVMDKGCGSFLIVFLLSLAGWIPGVIAAIIICQNNDSPTVVNVYGTPAQYETVPSGTATQQAVSANRIPTKSNTGLKVALGLILAFAAATGGCLALLGDKGRTEAIGALKNRDIGKAANVLGERLREVFQSNRGGRGENKDVAYWGNVPRRREFKASTARIEQVLLNSDNSTLVAIDSQGAIRILDPKAGTQHAQMPFPITGGITAAALFPNSTRIAFVVYNSGKSSISIWDWASGDASALAAFDDRTSQYATLGYILNIATSADGKTLVAADGTSQLHVWHWKGTPQYRPIERRLAISTAFLQPNRIVAAGFGENITIHDLQTGQQQEFNGGWANNEMATQLIAVPRTDNFFIGAGHGGHTDAGRIQLWRVDKMLESKPTSSGVINDLAVSADGKYLLVSLGNGRVEIRDAYTLATLQVLVESTASDRRIRHPAALSADGKLAVAGFENGVVRLWSK